jgi:low affinity Fe/Cu permease
MDTIKRKTGFFELMAVGVTKATGSTPAIVLAFLFVIAWGATGPIFHYSENWQFVINTGTNIITFLMVFLIQKSQNKDSLAIQLKLNELVASHKFASNRMVNVEDMSEEELKIIQKYYSKISELTKKEESLLQAHSIDEAGKTHDLKSEMEKELKEILQ